MAKIFIEIPPFTIDVLKRQLRVSNQYFSGEAVAAMIDQCIEEVPKNIAVTVDGKKATVATIIAMASNELSKKQFDHG